MTDTKNPPTQIKTPGQPAEAEGGDCHGLIYWFDADGVYDGEFVAFGAYYSIIDENGKLLTRMCGPYGNTEEASAACEASWEKLDLW